MRKIVSDSSCDIHKLDGIDFAIAPLKIVTEHREYVDDVNLCVSEMVEELVNYSGRSSTSCPNTNDWLSAFGDANEVFCVTMTSKLSGTYNSAMLAKKQYEETHPERRVHVFDSLSTGPEMMLIIEKIQGLIMQDEPFDDIILEVEEYSKNTGLLFFLESMNNLANNGRVSHMAAKVAGVLGIRVIGRANNGELEQLSKCRGESKTLSTVISHLKKLGYSGKKIKINHCLNEKAALLLAELIRKEFNCRSIEINCTGGLCSFYAEKKGVLIGFEK